MKKLLIYVPAFLLMACGGEKQQDDKAEVTQEEPAIEMAINTPEKEGSKAVMDPRTFGGDKSENQEFIDEIGKGKESEYKELLGYWVGDFGGNMINIHLYDVAGIGAEGYSVCAGNFRPIIGAFNKENETEYFFSMEEPGDDKYDGRFEFTINTEDMTLRGKWVQFSDGKEKEYVLKQRIFEYDSSVGEYPEASQRELTYDEVENMTELDLGIMRNEIYARHGYSFKNKDYRTYFEDKDWYMPLAVDVRDKLSDVEVINIELIYEYESYFEEYYDDYGR